MNWRDFIEGVLWAVFCAMFFVVMSLLFVD